MQTMKNSFWFVLIFAFGMPAAWGQGNGFSTTPRTAGDFGTPTDIFTTSISRGQEAIIFPNTPYLSVTVSPDSDTFFRRSNNELLIQEGASYVDHYHSVTDSFGPLILYTGPGGTGHGDMEQSAHERGELSAKSYTG